MKAKIFFHDYFYYTRTEKNGALVLCLLSFALLLLPAFLKRSAQQSKSPDFHTQFAHFTNVEKSPEQVNTTTTTLFDFNPNNSTKEEMIQLGLSPKLAQTIVNFRDKGGVFRHKEDLLKIYGMQQTDYQRLEQYIQVSSSETATMNSRFSSKRSPALLFSFDPNTTTKADFIKLGLPEKTAATILKFREKGGVFHKKEDLQKIYGLKSTDYERLASYVQLENKTPVANQKPIAAQAAQSPDFQKPTSTHTMIDVNQADAAEWQTLRGIGSTFAKRITNFRDKLGGFSNIEQVKETFGLPDSTFQAIKTQLELSPVLKKIAINTATIEELKAHPYIDTRQAAMIVSYREQHGTFQSIDDFRQMKALPLGWLEKISPYLKFD